MSFFYEFEKEKHKNKLKTLKILFKLFPELKLFLKEYQSLLKENNVERNFIVNFTRLSEKVIKNKKFDKYKISININFYDEIFSGTSVYLNYYIHNEKPVFVSVEITSLFVNIIYQNKGFGTKFTDIIKNILKPDIIEVFDPYPSAINFYSKNDFYFKISLSHEKIIEYKLVFIDFYDCVEEVLYLNNPILQEYIQSKKLFKFSENIFELPIYIINYISNCYWINSKYNKKGGKL